MASKILASIVILAIAMWSFGFPTWVPQAQALSLTTVSDTLSDSDLGVSADHTIVFTNTTAIANDETFTLTFSNEWNISTSSVAFGDIDVATGTDMTLAADCTGTEMVAASTSGQVLTVHFCPGDGASVPAGGTTTIQVGTNAAGGSNQFVNPAEGGTFTITIAGTMTDNGDTKVAIIDDVVVTASVDTTFVFTINGLPDGTSVNGSPTTTATSTTATSLPFETVTPGGLNGKTLAQNLTVTTNAVNGFSVTVQTDTELISSTGADINSFANGGASTTPGSWEGPIGYLDSDITYGHWGVTTDDDSLVGQADTFGTDQWVGSFIATSTGAVVIFAHDGPADGVTAHQGSTTVGYQIEITSFQEAGSDYTTNLTYIATPVF